LAIEHSTKFIVKNIAPDKKTIKIFNIPIKYSKSYNLLNIRYVTEFDIRDSLLKGSLRRKFLAGELEIVESNMDFLQFDPIQLSFLESIGIINGLQISRLDASHEFDILKPTKLGQILCSVDSDNLIFTAENPVVSDDGFILTNDDDIMIV